MKQIQQQLQYAFTLHQQGQLQLAEHIYQQVIALDAKNFDALHLMGVLQTKQKNLEMADSYFARAIQANPNNALCHYNYGIALFDMKRYQDAIASYDRAIGLYPAHATAHYNRGNAYQALKNFEQAVTCYDEAIALQPNYAEAYSSRGSALKELREYDAAVASCERAIAINPRLAAAYSNLGNVVLKRKDYACALELYEHALDLDGHYAEAHFNRGAALAVLKKYEAAAASYERAIALKPEDAKAHFNLGTIFFALKKADLAALHFERVLAMNPDAVQNIDYGYGLRLHVRQHLCDWTGLEDDFKQLLEKFDAKPDAKLVMAFEFLSMPSTAAQQKKCNEALVKDDFFAPTTPFVASKSSSHKIKIGYFSSDFRHHPVGQLTVGLFEAHDREHFEIYGFGLMQTDESELGQRLTKAFDHFIDISSLGLDEAVQLARSKNLDIAVNLNGHTEHHRNEIFEQRVAPTQVNYLGFAGTMGARFMDYIVADQTVIPTEDQIHYTEKVAYMPHSFFVSSYVPSRTTHQPTRAEHQLPEAGFVFCCFNNSYKISPDIFDVWMRLLAKVDGSVLWLSKLSETATRNLQMEAQKRGIAKERLIFAKRMDSHDDHLARLALADLFVDTLYYNAHTTAADALWAGVPIVTCLGQSFAGRVAASMLRSLGLDELVTTSVQNYEALSLELAQDAERLKAIKVKLADSRHTKPFFNTVQTAQELENIYTQISRSH
jgi:protein O-GlcNAc transferase